jgi:L-amino acid N-acyltransferase YncA
MIIRQAHSDDAPAMAAILNRIIAIGGTTAHQSPKSVDSVVQEYVTGPDVLSCVVAEDGTGVIGWQSVGWWQGEAHIGTFVAPGVQAKGIGAGLFKLTCDLLRKAQMTQIIASIRADNGPGLAYYARIGFVDIGHDPDFTLDDGRVVGRVHRRFEL